MREVGWKREISGASVAPMTVSLVEPSYTLDTVDRLGSGIKENITGSTFGLRGA